MKPNEKESGKDMQNKRRLKRLKRTRSINRGRKGDRLRGLKKSSAIPTFILGSGNLLERLPDVPFPPYLAVEVDLKRSEFMIQIQIEFCNLLN